MNSIYKYGDHTMIILVENSSCSLAVNSYGRGRGVYIAGLPFNFDNLRLIHRAIHWVAGKESEMLACFSTNPLTECIAYPEAAFYSVINNSQEEQETSLYMNGRNIGKISGGSMECRWFEMRGNT